MADNRYLNPLCLRKLFNHLSVISDSMDIWSILGIALVLAIVGWGIRLLKQRLDEQRYQDQLADLEFEGSVFSEVPGAANTMEDMRFVTTDPTSGPTPTEAPYVSPITSPLQAAVVPPVDNDQLPADMAAMYVMQQLQQSGLLSSVEGYIEVHGNAKGAAIIKLRNGTRALLVPHMESEAFMRRHARRVDMIIMVGSDGRGVVVTPLEELLSQNVRLG